MDRETKALARGYPFISLLSTAVIGFFLLLYSVEISRKGDEWSFKFNGNLISFVSGGGIIAAINYLIPDNVVKEAGNKLRKYEKKDEEVE